jgi:hypothetical protein
MRDFAKMAGELRPRFPTTAEMWTCYHLETNPYPLCDVDWGVCLAYHFDRGFPFVAWLGLVNRIRDWVEARSELRDIIKCVPFCELGTDFFTQSKPPFDGGYSTSHYEEFLYYGDCEPAPWFHGQLAELHSRVAESAHTLRSNTEEALLRRIVHATFIRPYSHLFWLDEAGWGMYTPCITADDIREWTKLSGK